MSFLKAVDPFRILLQYLASLDMHNSLCAFWLIIFVFLGLEKGLTQNKEFYDPPSWAKGIVWYQIFPERFRDGDASNQPDGSRLEVPENWTISEWTMDWYDRDPWEKDSSPDFYYTVRKRRFGGDLQGVIDQLDYLKSLGVGALYFNPLFDAPSEHKYDAAYYHHVDRNFGPDPKADEKLFQREDPADPGTWQWTSADSLFLQLIREVHQRDMKIIIDGVWNHTGTDFWAFRDLREKQEESPFKDWYIVNDYDDPSTSDVNEFDYEGWWGFKGLPVFREEDENLMPGIKEHIFAVTQRWMDPDQDGDPSDGVDGWRLDVAEEIGIQWWKDWHAHVRKINPAAITVAEIWTDKAKHYIKPGLFSSVMNYRFASACQDYFIDQEIRTDEFVERLEQIHNDYPTDAQHVVQNLMDSHDVPRFASMCVNPGREYDRNAHPKDGFMVRKPNADERRIQKLIALFQFTWPGAPMIYYGTEAGMWGADDPDDRKPMVWKDMKFEAEKSHPFEQARPIDTNDFSADIFTYYQQLAQMKNAHPILQYGELEVLEVSDHGMLFKRTWKGDAFWILINASSEKQSFEIGRYIPHYTKENVLSGKTVTGSMVEIEPYAGLIMRRK